MRLRWTWLLCFAVLGLAMLVCGLLVPAHLRAVDAGVIQKAGDKSPALPEAIRALAGNRRLGAAQMLAQAAQIAGMAGASQLGQAVTNFARQFPDAAVWGDATQLEKFFAADSNSPVVNEPFTGFILRQENRERALARLRRSAVPVVQELLRCRELKNTVLFPPSASASGQAFDAALAECGLLLDDGYLAAGLNREISTSAAAANHGGGSEPLEQVLMDFLSLGQRFNWDQLTAFVVRIPDAATLHQLTETARRAGDKLPVWFAAVQLSGEPSAVAKYAAKFPATGWQDIAAGLCYGAGGVKELVAGGRRFYDPEWRRQLVARNPFGGFYEWTAGGVWRHPALMLAVKWLFYLGAGFLLAAAFHFARPAVSRLERPLQVRGFHLFREGLFSVGFLLVVLLLSEPFLAQESQTGTASLRLHLPTAGGAIPAGIAGLKQTVMNPTILLTLLVFFVVQSLIYLACLLKLAEILRQAVPPRMKLKLLENEDHLFDAGLYVGFVGTIISLIIASLGLVKFSLMAAYSATSFGIIFVCIFKIFHLRPARRKLLLEAELAEAAAKPNLPS
jgi:hypothetical protein